MSKIPAIVLAIQFVCRLHDQTVLEALASTFFLALFVWVAVRFGGWSSYKEAWSWLRGHPRSMFLIFAGTASAPVMMLHSGLFSVPAMIAETLGAYFVFHAVLSLGTLAFEKAFRISMK